VVEELGRVVHLINAGFGEAPAFELVAKESAEPAASRFYRFLAAATAAAWTWPKHCSTRPMNFGPSVVRRLNAALRNVRWR